MNTRAFGLALLIGAAFIVGCSPTTDIPQVNVTRVHVRPSWSPDGLTIAFRIESATAPGIYLVDSSGANIRLLHAGTAVGFTWSPDSKWLMYTEGRNLFKIMATGDSITQITNAGSDTRPSWSPDGKRVAFVRNDVSVMVLDFATGNATDIIDYADFPTWHPNGDIVVLVPGSYSYTLYAINPDSVANARVLMTFQATSLCGFSFVSPKGIIEQEVVFANYQPYDYMNIWKADILGDQLTQLTVDGADYPSYSPDGSRIVYTRASSGDGGLWIMNEDGSGNHRLTTPAQ